MSIPEDGRLTRMRLVRDDEWENSGHGPPQAAVVHTALDLVKRMSGDVPALLAEGGRIEGSATVTFFDQSGTAVIVKLSVETVPNAAAAADVALRALRGGRPA